MNTAYCFKPRYWGKGWNPEICTALREKTNCIPYFRKSCQLHGTACVMLLLLSSSEVSCSFATYLRCTRADCIITAPRSRNPGSELVQVRSPYVTYRWGTPGYYVITAPRSRDCSCPCDTMVTYVMKTSLSWLHVWAILISTCLPFHYPQRTHKVKSVYHPIISIIIYNCIAPSCTCNTAFLIVNMMNATGVK